MLPDNFINVYLNRIGFKGAPTPNRDNLYRLHRAHMFSIPFENLDVIHHIGISMEIEPLFTKVVLNQRGGFCYELNYMFFLLLQQIGFKASLHSARVHQEGSVFSPEFDHLIIIVDLDGLYLVDVGFGRGFGIDPLEIKTALVQTSHYLSYKFLHHRDGTWLLQQKGKEPDWAPVYQFSLVKREIGDFSGMLHYHQHSEESKFTQKSLCSKPTRYGRVTLSGDTLIISEGEYRNDTVLPDREALAEARLKYFDLNVDEF